MKMAGVISNKSIFALSVISLVLLVPAGSWSRPIWVGDTVLEVPDPPGFARVTPRMAALFQLAKHFVGPANEEFLSYIPESEVQKALNNEIPDLERRCSVQTAKTLIDISVSKSDFSRFKGQMKTEMDAIFKKVEEQTPGLVENVNKGITEQTGLDAALSLSQVIPLPPHEETDRTLALSQFGKVGARDEAGRPVSMVFACTATLVHVKAKVLFLYLYAEESGLEWSRTKAKEWADSIVAANPPDDTSLARESVSRPVGGIRWHKAVQRGVAGAVLGAIAGLAAWIRRRVKN
jgi:hypothetical protein